MRPGGHRQRHGICRAATPPPDLAGVPFVAKPFDLDHLLRVVAQTVARPAASMAG